MTSPRYTPSSFAADARHFGKEVNISWLPHAAFTNVHLDQFEAARMQHRVVLAMRKAIREQYGTDDAYAAAIGMNRTRLGRLLGGTIVMRLEDVASARRNLGVGG